jgi:dipeptidyl aminopeptidase/acylaminoacyl peptidase
LLVASGLLVLLTFNAHAAETALPPLIDRELLFGDPDITAPQLSPDGTRISFIRPHKGTRNIWVKRTNEPFSAAKPITAETTRPIAGYYWSRDGKYVLFVRDQGGDENFNLYAVNPNDAPAAGSDVPAARNLTNLPGVRVQMVSSPKSQPDIMYIGLNDRDKAWHDLYRVTISTGARELVRENKDRIAGYVFDVADQLRLAMRVAGNGDTEILRIEPQGLVKIYECTVFESCSTVRFHKDGKRVYMVTNKGDVDLIGLALLDVATGKVEPVESDPEKRVDFGTALFSEATDELVGTAYVDDKVRVYWRDAKRKAGYEFLQTKYPNREIAVPSRTQDERLALVALTADTEPGEYVLFDYETRAITPQFRIREDLPREALAAMQSIRYPSSDGLQIPAYLTLPKGVAAKSLPLLVVPHGGPWGRDMWGYNSLAQFFANRGFAVLQPNFRASTGFGKKFLQAGNGEWGQKMQDDITWGVQHLVKQGIADPKLVAILGGSYGGYATLAGVAFTPDLYAAAVSIVGPSNLITLLNSIPAYWEAGRKQLYSRMADPTTPAGKALLEKQSPLNSASKIKTPLLVVQGANDPRVKQAESDQIVIALRDRNFPVEYLVAPDEGHGFAKPENSLAMFAASERFLAKHIAGIRHQADMKPEIAKRLVAITVDPKTVSLAPKADASKLAPAAPAGR